MNSDRYKPPEAHLASLTRTLLTICGLTLLLMTLYEVIKQLLFPDIMLWQSHVVTILFSSLVATGGAYIVLRQMNRLYHQTAADLAQCANTEAALRESERRYREQLHFMQVLLDSIPAPVFYKDAAGIYQGCNRPFEEYLGLPKDKIVGQSVYSISPPELADRYKAMDDALFAQGGTQVYEASVQHADGKRHAVMFHKATFEQTDGRLGGLVGVILDITERKQMEEALKEREALYRGLVNTMQDGLTLIADGKAIYASDRACEIFGYPREQYMQMTGIECAAPEERDRLRDLQAQTQETGQLPEALEFWIMQPDGTRRLIRNRYASISEEATQHKRLVVTTDITHQRRAETALHESEERLRMLMESAEDIIILQDLEGCYLYYNCPKNYGTDLRDAVGRNPLDIFGEQTGHTILTRLHQVAASGKSMIAENHVNWHGETLWFQDHIYPVRDEAERITAIATISRNITERKRTEQMLERRVAQLALLNDIGSKITSVLELEQVFNRVTTLVQSIFGYHHVGIFTLDHDTRELVMRARTGAFSDLFPLEHRIQLGAGMVGWVGQYGTTLLANRVEEEPHYINFYPDVIPTQAELSVPLRMGNQLLGVLDVQSPERDAFDENDVVVIETLASQITVAIVNAQLYQDAQSQINEREQAEAALRKSEARYHIVSDLISDVAYAFEVTPEGELIYEWMTGAFDRFSSFNPHHADEFVHWRRWIHPEDQETVTRGIETLLSGRPYTCEVRLLLPDGQSCWLSTRNHPVWNEEQHRVERIIGAAQDITEQKELEQLMLRTERLAAMGHITGTLAHEIKNPLQAIQNNLELVREFPLEPDEHIEALQTCAREVERLIEITQRVLSFTQNGKRSYQPLSLAQRVQQTLELLATSLHKATVTVTLDLPADLPPVLGAAEQIDQVLLNLIINAIEAMPDGGDLVFEAQVENGYVTLLLTNSGPPIPPPHLAHLFEPFFTTKPTGAGLGLFISHHIIEQHEGFLAAANLPDERGVVFELTLPRGDTPAGASQ